MTTPTSKGVTWGDDVVVRHPADSHCIAAAAAGFYDPWAEEDEGHADQDTGPSTRSLDPDEARRLDALGLGAQDEARRRNFYGPDGVRLRAQQRADRAWLVGSVHVRGVMHLDEQNDADCAAADLAGELGPRTGGVQLRRRISTTDRRRQVTEGEAPVCGDDESAAQHLESRNETDCDDADTTGVIDPPLDAWESEAIWCMEHGERLGLEPPESHPKPSDRQPTIPWTTVKHQRLSERKDLSPPAQPGKGNFGPGWLDDDSDDVFGHAAAGGNDRASAPGEGRDAERPSLDAARGTSTPAPAGTAHKPTRAMPEPARTSATATRGNEASTSKFGPSDHGQTMEPKLQQALDFAGRLGLLGDLPGRELPRDGESAVARDLRLGIIARARQTYDAGRLHTALTWFEEFMGVARREPIFMHLQHSGDIDSMQYNQETLDMFSEYVRRRGSRLRGRAGEEIKSDTIQTYVSMIKKLRTHEAHHTIVGPEVNVIGPAAHKRMRQLDGPPGERKLSLGLRARHLREAALLGFDRKSKRGRQEWGAALTAHNLLARGGEVCVVDSAPLDTARDLIIGAVEFREPSEVSEDLPWLTVELVPIKDTTARRRSAVMPIRRRGPGGKIGDDPMDTYDAIVLAIEGRIGRLPPARGKVEGPEALLPLFVGPKGAPWCTSDTRRLARRIAARLELDEELFGAKSFRIGGATDYRAIYGPEAAERVIKQRGRWWSDIHALYQRSLATEHLQGSAAIGDARGAELEALCKGWSQPTTFR